jgi:hypothetical protein
VFLGSNNEKFGNICISFIDDDYGLLMMQDLNLSEIPM